MYTPCVVCVGVETRSSHRWQVHAFKTNLPTLLACRQTLYLIITSFLKVISALRCKFSHSWREETYRKQDQFAITAVLDACMAIVNQIMTNRPVYCTHCTWLSEIKQYIIVRTSNLTCICVCIRINAKLIMYDYSLHKVSVRRPRGSVTWYD